MSKKPEIIPRVGKYRSSDSAGWGAVVNELGSHHQAIKVIQSHGIRDLWLKDPGVVVLVERHGADINVDDLRRACPWDTLILGRVPAPIGAGAWYWPLIKHRDRDLLPGEKLEIVPATLDLDNDGALILHEDATLGTWELTELATPRQSPNRQSHIRVLVAQARAAQVRIYAPPPPRRTLVYQHFDERNVLLYLGITEDPYVRGATHSATADWSQFAVRMEGEWLPSREAAEARERELIASLGPVFNLAHVEPAVAASRRSAYLASRLQPSLVAA